MFDLQAAALAADVTRVFAFKLSRDVSNRCLPGDWCDDRLPHLVASCGPRERILDLAKINAYTWGSSRTCSTS